MIKYILLPGYVLSKHDGDRHFISASQLIELYRLNKHECAIADNPFPIDYLRRCYPSALTLTPRFNGDYENHVKFLERNPIPNDPNV